MFDASEAGSSKESLAKNLSSCLKIAETEAKKSGHRAALINLSKEQVTILSRDIWQLRQDVFQLQEEVGLTNAQDRLRDRLGFLEKHTDDSLCKHAKAIDELSRSNDGLRNAIEARFSSIEHASHARHATVVERSYDMGNTLAELSEKCCKISADLQRQHAELGGSTESRLCTIQERLDLFGAEVCQLPNRHACVREDVHRTASANVERMEGMFADFSERYCAMLAGMECRLAELSSSSASMPDRVARVEQQQRDCTDRFAKDLQIFKRSRDQLESRVAEIGRESLGWQASVAGRVDTLERTVRDTAAWQAKELADLRAPGGRRARAPRRRGGPAHRLRGAARLESGCRSARRAAEARGVHGGAPRGLREATAQGAGQFARPRRPDLVGFCFLLLKSALVDSLTTALVDTPTRSECSPSLRAASQKTSPGGQSSPLSSTGLSKSRWGCKELRSDLESEASELCQLASPTRVRSRVCELGSPTGQAHVLAELASPTSSSWAKHG
ncbi:unnamed protein product [Prorocentrum cordatum]|uniref:Uncharacterized protein n=1 Tax=Prorocentrum cordatum TaxID=2364126 RepID=A0ABN9WI49_9DINO|nr:unnamed protein product [Polarella glacialis]